MTKTKSAYLALIAVLFAPLAANAAPIVIDFETITSGTIVRNEFLSDGLQITGAGSFSGLVQSTGDLGVGDFGNSQTQWAHMGLRDQPTVLTFVDPTDSTVVLGASAFSVRVGDGDPDSESFSIEYFDVFGTQIGSTLFLTTFTDGLTVSATSLDLGALIGSVTMTLLPGSASGAAFDDVGFTLAGDAGTPVPEPGTLALLGIGLAGMGLARRRKKA